MGCPFVQVDPSIIFGSPDANSVCPEDLWMVSEVPAVVRSVPIIPLIVSDDDTLVVGRF